MTAVWGRWNENTSGRGVAARGRRGVRRVVGLALRRIRRRNGIACFAAECIVAAAAVVHPVTATELRVDVGEGDRIRTASAALVARAVQLSDCAAGCRASIVVSARVARWWQPYETVDARDLWNASVLPALRIESPFRSRTIVVEAGVGVHYLSGRSLDHRRFGSNWQFGERFALGTSGPERVGWIFWLEHVSNGGFASANTGVTFFGIGMQIPLTP